MGSATNDARGSGGDYAGSVDDRQAVEGTGAFRLGAGGGVYDSGFAQGPAGIDSTATGSEAGSYTVRGGDTLAGIAQQLWGDAGLWYKLAEANGLGAGTALAAGQTLRLPAGVLRSAHSDATLSPYDHAAAIGDIQPTTPQPPAPRTSSHKKHCGGFGTVLLAVVAVAVTVATAGAAVAALSPTIGGIGSGIGAFLGIGGATTGLGAATLVGVGAVAGAAGSIASQAVGVATGIQDKFSWKGVALAGISGGVGGGLGAALPGGGVGLAAARGALGNAATQGIALATGLQSKFDFAGVAAAGVGGGAGAWVGGRLGTSFGASLAAGTASALAGAATRSAIEGSGFGDNIRRAIPDAIGSAIGNALARSLARPPGARSAPALAKAGGDPVAEANDTVGAEAEAAARGGGGWVNSEAIARAVDDALLRDGPLAAGFEPVLERDLAVLAMGNAVYAAGESRGRAQYEAISREYAALSASDKLNFQAANHILPPPPASAGTDPNTLVTVDTGPALSFGELVVWENNLQAREAAHGGLYSNSPQIWASYAANREGLVQNYAYADRQVWELTSAALNLDAPTAAFRMAVNGEINWGNGIAVGAAVGGPLLGRFAKGAGRLLHSVPISKHLVGGESYASFTALKRALGSAGEGRQWHHIVEQSKLDQFGTAAIQNSRNVVAIPSEVHQKITGFYGSKQRFSEGMRVRDWLSKQSFDVQYDFGMRQIERFGSK